MGSLGFVFAITAALFWVCLDVSRKKMGNNLSASAAVAGLTLFQLPMLAVAIIVGEFFATPTGEVGKMLWSGIPPLETGYLWPALASTALNVAANFLFLRAVQLSPLSLTVPYLSFTPVFTAISGIVVLGETPGPWGWAGITTVCVGAFFLNPGSRDRGIAAPIVALCNERGSLYMLIVALLWSLAPVFDKIGVQKSSVTFHTAAITAGIFLAFWLGRTVRDKNPWPVLAEFRAAPWLLAAAAAFNVSAMVMQLSAYAFISVAYVETLKRAIGVIGAILSGWLIFGEKELGRRLVGASVMVVGVALVILAKT